MRVVRVLCVLTCLGCGPANEAGQAKPEAPALDPEAGSASASEPAPPPPAPTEATLGVPASEHRGPIAARTRQLIVIGGAGWDDIHGRGQRFERSGVGGSWRAVGDGFDVVFGHAGLGWGRGLHGEGAPTGEAGPIKREGDGRSPAGVFAIGAAYGRAALASTALAYTPESDTLSCVDDPDSAHYNRIVDAAEISQDWASAEPMRRYYELAIVVEHNPGCEPALGSCIFLHPWKGPDTPVTGCTAMASETLDELAAWLEPGAVVVTLPDAVLDRQRERWALP